MGDVGRGGVQDGHGEKVRESQKPVHYDYKTYWRSMMREFSWMLLLVFPRPDCGITVHEGKDISARASSRIGCLLHGYPRSGGWIV